MLNRRRSCLRLFLLGVALIAINKTMYHGFSEKVIRISKMLTSERTTESQSTERQQRRQEALREFCRTHDIRLKECPTDLSDKEIRMSRRLTPESQITRRQQRRQEVLQEFCRTHNTSHSKCPTESLLVSDRYRALWCNISQVASETINWRIASLSVTDVPMNESLLTTEVLQRYGLRWLSTYAAEEQRERLQKYYKFIFVRHPLLRVISSYEEKFVQGQFQEDLADQQLISIRRPMKSLPQKNLDFSEFVGLSSKINLSDNEHWLKYELKCMPCNIRYDFIGNLETFTEDFSHILRRVFKVMEKSARKSAKYVRRHTTNASLVKAWQYIDKLNFAQRKTLYEHCKHDAQMFGYSLDGILNQGNLSVPVATQKDTPKYPVDQEYEWT